MTSTSAPMTEQFRTALQGMRALPTDVALLRGLTDAQLLELNGLHAEGSRIYGAVGVALAGELAHRSRPELGSDGLARRTGHRTIENLLKSTTGATKEQVLTVVAAGALLTELANDGEVDEVTGEYYEPAQPWLRPVAEAVAAGSISAAAANSIGRGLGSPHSAVTAPQLESAAVELVAQAIAGVDADRLWRNARGLRDELDLAGVKIREEERRALRGLTHHPLPDGGGIASWRMDPETYALFTDTYDRLTSPKRGGVRFVDPRKVARAKAISDDERTPAQLASDGFLHLVVAGADVDDSRMLGSGAPVVRVTTTQEALSTRAGLGRIDGQADPVSIETVERLRCDGTELLVAFDPDGRYLEAGAEHRLFSRRQREVLAVIFGGCMDPDCDRPPSWCEAHHIEHVRRDGGKTTVVNGILLCKYHHLKYHNDGYEICRDSFGKYWKIPPKWIDPDQSPILMPLKTRNLADLQRA
jgi:hypothetical protein